MTGVALGGPAHQPRSRSRDQRAQLVRPYASPRARRSPVIKPIDPQGAQVSPPSVPRSSASSRIRAGSGQLPFGREKGRNAPGTLDSGLGGRPGPITSPTHPVEGPTAPHHHPAAPGPPAHGQPALPSGNRPGSRPYSCPQAPQSLSSRTSPGARRFAPLSRLPKCSQSLCSSQIRPRGANFPFWRNHQTFSGPL
jgi:hypothetical protein